MGVPTIDCRLAAHWTILKLLGPNARGFGRVDWAMRSRLESEAPGTAAVLGPLEGWLAEKRTKPISAAVELVKELRSRRQAAKKQTIQRVYRRTKGLRQKFSTSATVRDAIRDLLRGKGKSGD